MERKSADGQEDTRLNCYYELRAFQGTDLYKG